MRGHYCIAAQFFDYKIDAHINEYSTNEIKYI